MSSSDSSASDLEGTPALSQARSRVGAVLRGKWKLERLVGMGGMGAVYEATHRNGRRSAIKVLLPLHGADRRTVQRFLKEGYVANELKHPGAVEIFDDDYTEDGLPFLVMELLEGRSLSDLLERGPLDVAEAVRIGSEVLDVLATAHTRGIVHRDIKPDNIFVLRDGRIKLLDFGIARLRTMTTVGSTTASGALLGTPAYMAPEQARGRVEQVDARSDIFGVGATLYVALSGREVREGPTLNELLLLAMTEPPKPIRAVASDVPEGIAEVVDRALCFDREQRWPSASAMRDALRGLPVGFASTEPRIVVASHRPVDAEAPAVGAPTIAAAPVTAPVPDGPKNTGNRKIAIAVALVAVIALAVGASVVRLRPRSAPVLAGTTQAATRDTPAVEDRAAPSALPSAEPARSAKPVPPSVPPSQTSSPRKRGGSEAAKPGTAPPSSPTPTAPPPAPAPDDPLNRRL